MAMSAVAAMHEQMHEGTRRKNQVRQGTKQVRPVLGYEKKEGGGQKTAKNKPKRGFPKAAPGGSGG